jgi:hypothetical protein
MLGFAPNFWPLRKTFRLARIVMAFARAWWANDV